MAKIINLIFAPRFRKAFCSYNNYTVPISFHSTWLLPFKPSNTSTCCPKISALWKFQLQGLPLKYPATRMKVLSILFKWAWVSRIASMQKWTARPEKTRKKPVTCSEAAGTKTITKWSNKPSCKWEGMNPLLQVFCKTMHDVLSFLLVDTREQITMWYKFGIRIKCLYITKICIDDIVVQHQCFADQEMKRKIDEDKMRITRSLT